MQYKIVADSSSNVRSLFGVEFENVPLKIITKEKEYVDVDGLDLAGMAADLRAYKGTSGTSCPNVYDWMSSFGDAENVFAVAITSNLSGSCNAARQASEQYMEENPGRKACVFDSLSAGPELRLIVEKLREGVLAEKEFEVIQTETEAYMKHTHLLFTLRSLNNLARNGRVSPAVAKLAGVLGIVIVGKASEEGTLQQMHKCRGEKRAIDTLYKEMKAHGYEGGRVRIGHNFNLEGAKVLESAIREEYPDADIFIEQSMGLCLFYAEEGGLMVGYEDKGV